MKDTCSLVKVHVVKQCHFMICSSFLKGISVSTNVMIVNVTNRYMFSSTRGFFRC